MLFHRTTTDKKVMTIAHLKARWAKYYIRYIAVQYLKELKFIYKGISPIATKLWWNGPWMAPFHNCVRWSRLPTKMATKLKIEKRGVAHLKARWAKYYIRYIAVQYLKELKFIYKGISMKLLMKKSDFSAVEFRLWNNITMAFYQS
jgi:hypothetical protein